MKPNLLFSLLLAALPTAALADNKLEPRDPIVSQTPARAEWTVRVSEKFPDTWATDESWDAQGGVTPPAAATRTIRGITYAKDAARQTYQVTTRWTTGDSEQEWIVMGQHVAERPGGGLYIVGAERLMAQELKVTDFPELAWVERKHFTGVKTYQGRLVFVFEEQFNRKRMTPTEARQYYFAQQSDRKVTPDKVFKPRFPKVVAYLDVTTQLPVLSNDGTKLRTYSYKTPDAGPLQPPQQIVDFIRRRQTTLAARIAPPAGPGKKASAAP